MTSKIRIIDFIFMLTITFAILSSIVMVLNIQTVELFLITRSTSMKNSIINVMNSKDDCEIVFYRTINIEKTKLSFTGTSEYLCIEKKRISRVRIKWKKMGNEITLLTHEVISETERRHTIAKVTPI